MSVQIRAQRTRQLILDAAGVVFDRHGYGGASMAMIVAEGGGAFSQGALYFHFPTKRSIGIAMIETEVARTQQPVARLMDEGRPALELLLSAVRGYADLIGADPVVRAGLRLTVEERTLQPESDAAYRTWLGILREIVVQGKGEGTISESLDTDDLAWHLGAAFTGTQITSGLLCGGEDLLRRLTFAWDVTVRAMVPPELVPYWAGRVVETFRR